MNDLPPFFWPHPHTLSTATSNMFAHWTTPSPPPSTQQKKEANKTKNWTLSAGVAAAVGVAAAINVRLFDMRISALSHMRAPIVRECVCVVFV